MSASTITPDSCPTSSATRRSGVSESRLKKPVSMSIATFVPALMEANIAPWTNVSPSAKVR
jgi:hypothetical protein